MRVSAQNANGETNLRVQALNKCQAHSNQGGQQLDVLGRVWQEQEVAGWRGVWTRVGNSNEFTARFTHTNGGQIGGRLRMFVQGKTVKIERWNPGAAGRCDYIGTFNANYTAVSGTYRCTNPATGAALPTYRWSARISR
jgi:hypothetical protein